MKKTKSFIAIALVGIMTLTGCSFGDTKMSYYDECSYEEGAKVANINKNLFYQNELDWNKTVSGADPAVMQITDKEDPDYGKFVLTLTSGMYSFTAYMSSDLVNWEPIGPIMQADDDNKTDKSKVLYFNTWAPEMTYDEEDGKYYLFFSATPCNKASVTGYKNDSGSQTNKVFQNEYTNIPYVAVSDSFRGPFELIDFSDSYRFADGTAMKNAAGEEVTKAASAPIEHNEIQDNAMGYSYFLKYSVFDPYQIWNAIVNSSDPYVKEIVEYEPQKILRSIDYHPFVASNGDKYLYFTCNKDGAFSDNNNTYVMGIKMNSWTEPDYSTLTRLSRYGYYDVEGTMEATYEKQDAHINEGAWMTEHNGKFYLTLSVNGYGTTFYKVVQAISDSPLGPFRKLTEDEGGVLLGADGIDAVSGPGHHALVEIGNEQYIVYHKHNDPLEGGNARHVSMNKVEWVTIKDKDGNDLDVMYANGPTVASAQLLPTFAIDYENIASQAKVSADSISENSGVKYLTDGLIPITTGVNAGFMNTYVKSTEFTDETTITLTFDDYKTVKGIMIHNSEWIESAFYEIEKIEFSCRKGGKEKVKYIEHLAFDWKANSNQGFSMSPAGAAIAEFNEIEVKEIRITVKPATTEQVSLHDKTLEAPLAIGEIVVLGKK